MLATRGAPFASGGSLSGGATAERSGRGFALLLQLEDALQPLFVDIAMMDEERAEVMAPAQLRLHLEAFLHLRLGDVSLLDGDLSEQPDPVRHAPCNIRSKPARME